MDTFRQDLRYACRQLARRPGFAAVAILSLALGIGGNTAVFGIVDSFVLHPFAFPDADRLLIVGPSFPKLSSETRFVEVLSPAEYEDIRQARSFASTARPERVSSAPVGSSANITLGSPTRARAMATRCCWPPESRSG